MNKETLLLYFTFTLLFIILYHLIYIFLYKCLKYFFPERIEGFTNQIVAQQQAKQSQQQPQTIVLLGDSSLNNNSYVKKDEAIQQLLLKKIASNKQSNIPIYYMPKDEATIADIYDQFANIPADIDNANTSFFISVGGNDILTMEKSGKNITQLFAAYEKLIKAIQTRYPNSKYFLLNIYFPLSISPAQKTAITQWNSLLYNFATDQNNNNNTKLLEMNYKLTQAEDFVNEIEPSFQGGEKIVALIAQNVA